MKKRIGVFAVATFLAFSCLTGCGASRSSDSYSTTTAEVAAEGAYDNNYEAADVYDNAKSVTLEESKSVEADQEIVDTSRKLITTINISAETEDLDAVISNIQAKVKELGEYVESSNIYNGSKYSGNLIKRDASLTLRIPAKRLDSFVETVEGSTNITNKSSSVEDVTLNYVDIESKKSALKAEEKRLLEIVEKAESIEDIIKVENRLSEVRYQIESIESQLRTYDNKVNYSTVYLDLTEVKEYTPVAVTEKGPFQRMGEGFVKSVKSVVHAIVEFFVWFVIHIPQLLVLAVIIVIIVVIIKKVNARVDKKNKHVMDPVNDEVKGKDGE